MRQLQNAVRFAIQADGAQKLTHGILDHANDGPVVHGIEPLLLSRFGRFAAIGGGFLFRFEIRLDEVLAAFDLGTCTFKGLVHRLVRMGVGREVVEVGLQPLVEGVVVTLRALDARAEKDARGERHVVERHVGIALVVADGRIVPCEAFGGEHLAHEDIVGLVGAQALADVAAVGGWDDIRRVDEVRLETQHISPDVEEMRRVAFACEQVVDQGIAFAALTRF